MRQFLWVQGIVMMGCLSFMLIPVCAQTPFENPLEVEEFDDPLLPNPPIDRPLSPLEKFRLEEELERLNQDAKLLYQEGKVQLAFEVWYRELRLRQQLDLIPEVIALGRVGEVAWSENRSLDFRNIRERLRDIEMIAKQENQRQVLVVLAESYEKMREIEGSIEVYQFLLDDSENPNQLLEKIALLYRSRFDYSSAINVYQTLLSQAESNGNPQNVIPYFIQLKTLYQENGNLHQTIVITERLISLYQQENNQQPLPALLVSLGEIYTQVGELAKANQIYREAFDLAWSQQKALIASEALENLAQLYQSRNSIEMTLEIYEQLLIVQEYAVDYYGLMITYDKIGEIHQQFDRLTEARNAYENALKLAQSLSYQETYFQEKIQNLN